MAVTVGPDGRVVVTKNKGPVRPDSAAGRMAIMIFGDGVELPYGYGSNYPIKISNAHAEARGIQAFIKGDVDAKFNYEVRQACSHYSCDDCSDKQDLHQIKNVTGTKKENKKKKIGRDYVLDLWNL